MAEEITIDPYIPKLPLQRYVDENGRLTQEARKRIEYQDKVIHDIIQGVKTNQTNVTNITTSETFETSQGSGQASEQFETLKQLEDLIPNVHVREFKPAIKTNNCIAVDHDFIDARRGIKVTLAPETGSQIITANGDGSNIEIYSTLKIHMNGKVANSVFLNRKDTVIHWYLFESDTEQFWRGA